MNFKILVVLAIFCCLALYVSAEEIQEQKTLPVSSPVINDESSVHTRSKRTLFLKKKILGAGLLGFGLGVVKGYKYGYHRAPEVHHVYLSPPPAHIEYVEKPVYRIIEKPVFKHVESWHPDPPSTYGAW